MFANALYRYPHVCWLSYLLYISPDSSRARFGESVVKNAVHCTDLPEDGEMECRYFFETLSSL